MAPEHKADRESLPEAVGHFAISFQYAAPELKAPEHDHSEIVATTRKRNRGRNRKRKRIAAHPAEQATLERQLKELEDLLVQIDTDISTAGPKARAAKLEVRERIEAELVDSRQLLIAHRDEHIDCLKRVSELQDL